MKLLKIHVLILVPYTLEQIDRNIQTERHNLKGRATFVVYHCEYTDDIPLETDWTKGKYWSTVELLEDHLTGKGKIWKWVRNARKGLERNEYEYSERFVYQESEIAPQELFTNNN